MTDLTRQAFDTADVLRLELERDPEPDEFHNLLENPDGALGGWGWVPGTMGKVGRFTDPLTAETWLEFWPLQDQVNTAYSVPVACTPGAFVRAAYDHSDNLEGSNLFTRPRIRFLDAELEQVEDGPVQSWSDGPSRNLGPNEVPAGCFYVQLIIGIARNADGDNVANPDRRLYVRNARLGEMPTAEEWPDGPVPDISEMPSHYLEDVIELAGAITVKRAPLDANTLTVTLEADSVSDVDGYGEGMYGLTYYGGHTVFDGSSLRPGKNVILTAIVSTLGLERRLFTGEVQTARVDYDFSKAVGRALITINAVDGAARMTAKTHANVSPDINDIHSYLEHVGIPWNIDGAVGTDPGALLAAETPGATVLDQVIKTRDTNIGSRVWVDADGVLMAREPGGYGDAPGPFTLTDRSYNTALAVAWDTEETVNSVRVTVLNGANSHEYGPFERPRSIRRWGRRKATYTIVSSSAPDLAEARAAANAILNLTADPELRVQSATLPILAQYDPLSGAYGYADLGSMLWAGIDLYDPIEFRNDSPEMSLELEAISIEDNITPRKWLRTLGLGVRGRPALPTSS